ncbi:MAG: GNAT family N-acetyltransferase [Gordonia sp. (in: high G+C Gram-positive bacteria)]
MIRQASAADCAAIAAIYAYYVENSVATFALVAPTVEDWDRRRVAVEAAGRPFLVLHDDDDEKVLGFAYLGDYRGNQGWRYTAEDSIYLAPGTEGRGLGFELLRTLLDAADPANVRQVMAMISDEIESSVKLHRKAGFVEVGRSPAVGEKFGRALGCVYMQKSLV